MVVPRVLVRWPAEGLLAIRGNVARGLGANRWRVFLRGRGKCWDWRRADFRSPAGPASTRPRRAAAESVRSGRCVVRPRARPQDGAELPGWIPHRRGPGCGVSPASGNRCSRKAQSGTVARASSSCWRALVRGLWRGWSRVGDPTMGAYGRGSDRRRFSKKRRSATLAARASASSYASAASRCRPRRRSRSARVEW
jgi:hypothetical protein